MKGLVSRREDGMNYLISISIFIVEFKLLNLRIMFYAARSTSIGVHMDAESSHNSTGTNLVPNIMDFKRLNTFIARC